MVILTIFIKPSLSALIKPLWEEVVTHIGLGGSIDPTLFEGQTAHQRDNV
jgi:hypothetical protein